MKRFLRTAVVGGEPPSPRPFAVNRPLAFKADVTLAIQLITRHRAARLVLVMVLCMVPLSWMGEAGNPAPRQQAVLLIAGILGPVAGSRLLARGGPLAGARRASGSGLLTVAGRLTGCVFLLGPVLLGVAVAMLRDARVVAATLPVALVLGAAVAALAMAVTPALGASPSAALGFLAAAFGHIRPSAVAAVLVAWPFARTPAVLCWNALPLSWRAARWLSDGAGDGDPWVLVAWLAAAMVLCVWAIDRFPEHGREEPA